MFVSGKILSISSFPKVHLTISQPQTDESFELETIFGNCKRTEAETGHLNQLSKVIQLSVGSSAGLELKSSAI